MRRIILLNVAFLLVTAVAGRAVESVAPYEYAPNEIIVKFGESVAEAVEKQVKPGKSAGELTLSPELDDLHKRHRIKEIKPVFKNFKKNRQRLKALLKKDKALLTQKEKHILRRLKRAPKGAKVPDLSRIYKIQVDLEPGQSLQDVVAAYNSNPDVEYAELNYIVSINLTPNDPLYSIQWPLHNTGQMYPESEYYSHPPGTPDCDIDAPEAWNKDVGSPEVVVAVIDTGVDYNHRDLQGNMWVNKDELNGTTGIDDDGNGHIDDIYGYDFINNDADPKDDHGHGTHCAGIIGARGHNGLDITGVCWRAKIMAVKFLSAGGSGSSADAVSCFYYAVQNGADVTSNSWGGEDYSQTSQDAIDYAYSQGVIMVAAAGNDDSSEPFYPAYYEHMIAVAATNSNDERASFSNFGDWVDIAAPGVDILSLRADETSMGTTYDDYTTIASGTSMACPHVAGVVGLLVAHYPHAAVAEIVVSLFQAADDVSGVNPGYGGLLGAGRVNASNGLTSLGFRGLIELDRDVYSCDDIVAIEVLDVDLQGQETQDMTMTTDGSDLETLTLIQDINRPCFFAGSIATSADAPLVQDGILQVSHDEIITAVYQDANDGTGNLRTVGATATLDCQGPVISEVQLQQLAGTAAAIAFETDEPATAQIRCGLTCGGPYPIVGRDDTLADSHTVIVMRLTGQTNYYFIVEANDASGNQTIDDNAGACYSFTTMQRPTTIGLHVPDEYPTIQGGIDAAADGETVWVAAGLYTGAGNRDVDFGGKAIAVRSEEGAYLCIIDCDASSSDKHRAFNFVSGEGPDSVLHGLTIINGYGPEQGYFRGSYKDRLVGGAIYCGESSPTITNCIFRNNRTVRTGGAIYCADSDAVISNCVFEEWNRARYGGAICTHGSPLITDCYFTDNKALTWGGALCCIGGAPKIRNCTVTGNKVGASGGGMYLTGAATVENCLISHNIANPLIASHNIANPLKRAAFAAGASGGGVECDPSYTKLINCTIVGNWAYTRGGGIYSNLGSRDKLIITNCIIWDNWPGQIRVIRYENNLVVTYSDIQGGWAGEGNIDADPCFADPTNGDYRLVEDSRCIDAGTNNPQGGLPVMDIEGTPRPLAADEDGNSVADMGAYEFWPQVAAPVIQVSTGQLEFFSMYSQGNPDDQILSIRNWGEYTLDWEISEDCPWLQVTPLSGESRGEFDDVVLSVDVGDMPPGDYGCVLTIWAAGANNSPRAVQVNLHIQMPVLVLDRQERHIYYSGGRCLGSYIEIENKGTGSMLWQVTEDCSWVEVEAAGELAAGQNYYADLEMDCALPPGDYNCALTVSAEVAENSPQTFQLYFHVLASVLSVSGTEFEFSALLDRSNPEEQILSIWNGGEGTLVWEITEDCPWLEVSPLSGVSAGEVDQVALSVDTADMEPGDYNCVLTIWAEGAVYNPRLVNVNLHVQGPILELSSGEFEFRASKDNPIPPSQTLSIGNTGGGTLNWQIVEDCNWLEVDPLRGECTTEVDEVPLSVDANGLDYGSYSCQLTVSGPNADNSPQTVEVSLHVLRPQLAVEPNAFGFWAYNEGPNPTDQILSIRNTGCDTLNWEIGVLMGGDWLNVYPLAGESTGECDDVILSVDIADLSLGWYIGVLTVSAADADNSPQTTQINLLVGEMLLVPTGDYPTIQAAIDAAVDGHVVVVADGTYTGDGNRDIDFKGKAITVRSENGPANCIIDCQGTAMDPHRGFYFHSGETTLSVVEGFTITGGYAIFGGGMYNDQSSPTVRNCVFAGNTADWYGGGMDNWYSSPTLVNCVFSGNSADEGGGIDNAYGSPELTNCTFSGNTAAVSGGGIFNFESSTTITNCILWGDVPEEIYIDSATPVVTYSDVEGGFSGEGNIDADPLFVDAAEDDYHLLGDSPAIDAGNPASDWSNEPWPNGSRVNMGAYANTNEATRSRAGFGDLATLAAYWLEDEPFVDIAPEPDGDGLINFLDFAVFADYWALEE